MAYATVADVQGNIPAQMCTISDGFPPSQPSATLVTQWLESASAFIDGSLRWKYIVPITDATDILVLREACALLAAARVWDVLGGHSAQEPAGGAALRTNAYDLLVYDRKGNANAAIPPGRSYVELPNTTLATTGEAALGEPMSTFTDPADPMNEQRMFSIGMQF